MDEGGLRNIVIAEERTMGSVRLSPTYRINSAGLVTSMLIFILFVGGQVLALLADISLESWASSATNQQESWNSRFFQQFLYFTIAATVAGIARAVLFYFVGLKASTVVHGKALHAVIHSPMDFFTSNPVARTLNKFSADLEHGRTASFTLFTHSHCYSVSAVFAKRPCNSLDGHLCSPWSWCCGGCDGIFCNRVVT